MGGHRKKKTETHTSTNHSYSNDNAFPFLHAAKPVTFCSSEF